MRKFVILCAAFFCLAVTASAQDFTGALETASPEAVPATPPSPSLIPEDRDPWQINAGFQYEHYSVFGLKFHDFAFQSGVTRYFTDRFAVDGTALAGFGHEGNPSIVAKSVFLGGGPRVSLYNRSHVELWAHVLGGWQHFRFTQSGSVNGTVIGSNSHIAFMAGGGMDYKIQQGRLFWRVEANYLGANFAPFSSNYFIGTGLALNF